MHLGRQPRPFGHQDRVLLLASCTSFFREKSRSRTNETPASGTPLAATAARWRYSFHLLSRLAPAPAAWSPATGAVTAFQSELPRGTAAGALSP